MIAEQRGQVDREHYAPGRQDRQVRRGLGGDPRFFVRRRHNDQVTHGDDRVGVDAAAESKKIEKRRRRVLVGRVEMREDARIP